MSRGLSNKEIIVLDQDSECHCFGYSQQPQQYFLSKHKSLQLINKPSYYQPPQPQQEHTLIKSTGKRSLRKNASPAREQPMTARSNDNLQDYYPSDFVEGEQRRKEGRTRGEEGNRYNKAIKTERSIQLEDRRVNQPVVVRNNNFKTSSWQPPNPPQYFYAPVQSPQSPPRLVVRQSNQPTPVKINFSHSPPPQKYSPQVSPRDFVVFDREAEAKKAPLSEFKEEVRINIRESNKRQSPEKLPTDEIVDFQLTEDNLDSPRMMPAEMKKIYVHAEDKPKNLAQMQKTSEYFKFGETFQSRIEKPKSNKKQATHKSKIETNKSRIDPKKSSIGDTGKSKVRSLRDQKKSLKKIDDVEEIRSMIDSDQLSQDKQSVVLGRLHEYGSMLDPSLSITTPTLRSKLVSMNTQSSTIGKSYLKPFQFNLQRNHFK